MGEGDAGSAGRLLAQKGAAPSSALSSRQRKVHLLPLVLPFDLQYCSRWVSNNIATYFAILIRECPYRLPVAVPGTAQWADGLTNCLLAKENMEGGNLLK